VSKKRQLQLKKRKEKLAKRAERQRLQPSNLAYQGNKFHTDELIPVFFATETAIYQAYTIAPDAVTDPIIADALSWMILQYRQGTPFPPLPADLGYSEGKEKELVVSLIRSNWKQLFQETEHPGTDALQGVLRTTLGSISTWSSPSPKSRGYLNYLRGFLRKAGVSVRMTDAEGEAAEDEGPDELFELGEEWCETGNPDIEKAFVSLAEKLTNSGQSEHVSDICEELLGMYGDGPAMPLLSALALRGQALANRLKG
jgi:hypothetical protein